MSTVKRKREKQEAVHFLLSKRRKGISGISGTASRLQSVDGHNRTLNHVHGPLNHFFHVNKGFDPNDDPMLQPFVQRPTDSWQGSQTSLNSPKHSSDEKMEGRTEITNAENININDRHERMQTSKDITLIQKKQQNGSRKNKTKPLPLNLIVPVKF